MKNGNDLGTVLKDLRKQQVTVLKISDLETVLEDLEERLGNVLETL
ncbi:10768_t:CDS:2, partial [Rhizophagus irregularis]